MSLYKDLQAVRAFLRTRRNWQQGAIFAPNNNRDCACLLGACMIAVGGRSTQEGRDRYNALEEALVAKLPTGFFALPQFNDDPDTTLEKVHGLLDRAILDAQQRQGLAHQPS